MFGIRGLIRVFAWTGPFCLIATAACDDEGPRVYTAQAYEPEAGCLDDYVAIGLVTADGLFPSCAPVCLQQSNTLYVSTVCPPYPDTTVSVDPQDSGECAAALALAESEGGGYCSASAGDDEGGGGGDADAFEPVGETDAGVLDREARSVADP
ncbi:MAG: hypothetical protein ABSC94_19950 [Polyangiaceae bacterium]|jgi:hypothetical protein